MKLAWAASGAGMGARAVMNAHLAGLLRSKLDLVVIDRVGPTDSLADFCNTHAIDLRIVTPTTLEEDLLEAQRLHGFGAMGLTFNRLLPQSVIDAFGGRIFNLHLSLLPMFPGFGATRKALASGLPCAGVTVHFIDAGVDTGPTIAQRKVVIEASDSEASLGRRQFEAAVPLLLQTVRLLENDKVVNFEAADADLVQFAGEYCRSF
jgi:phosphoribosylglycinamide formyltransferase-1